MRARSTQDAAQFGFTPSRKFVLRLDGVDRSNGELISAIEGDFLYVEKTDYPVLLTYFASGTLEQVNMIAHAGLIIPGPFKGLIVSHPVLATIGSAAQTFNLSLLLGKAGQTVSNEFAYPFSNHWPSVRAAATTAVLRTLAVLIPPGSKWLNELTYYLPGTTVTSASFALVGLTGPTFVQLSAPSIANLNNQPYLQQNDCRGYMDVSTVGGSAALFKLQIRDVPIPSGIQHISINVDGTGFAGAWIPGAGGESVKASFA